MPTIEKLMRLAEEYADMRVAECNENFGKSKPANDARNTLKEELETALIVAFDAGFAAAIDMPAGVEIETYGEKT